MFSKRNQFKDTDELSLKVNVMGNREAIENFNKLLNVQKFTSPSILDITFEPYSIKLTHLNLSVFEMDMKHTSTKMVEMMIRNSIGIIIIVDKFVQLDDMQLEFQFLRDSWPNNKPLILIGINSDFKIGSQWYEYFHLMTLDPNNFDIEWFEQEIQNSLFSDKNRKQIDDVSSIIDNLSSICLENHLKERKEEENTLNNDKFEEGQKIIYHDDAEEEYLLSPTFLTDLICEYEEFEPEVSQLFKYPITAEDNFVLNFICEFYYNGRNGPKGGKWNASYHHYEILNPGFNIKNIIIQSNIFSDLIEDSITWFNQDYDNDITDNWIDDMEILSFFEDNWKTLREKFDSSSKRFDEILVLTKDNQHYIDIITKINEVDTRISQYQNEISKLTNNRETIKEEFDKLITSLKLE